MREIEKFEKLKEMGYSYDPETGDLTNHKRKIITGKGNGYLRFAFYLNNKQYNIYAHRFAWWFYYNELPNLIDHINRIRTDNRISNLRSVTNQKNMFNMDCKGYTYNKLRKKYQAQIMLNGNNLHLGLYKTESEAHAAYLAAKKIYHII